MKSSSEQLGHPNGSIPGKQLHLAPLPRSTGWLQGPPPLVIVSRKMKEQTAEEFGKRATPSLGKLVSSRNEYTLWLEHVNSTGAGVACEQPQNSSS
mmetsp:Transcript_13609/g.19619  ORF Transcript_13609/g.19619 Transcript_13609/m.19619 type:complete len:96 (-) Transcript_13609:485-772(-)